MLMRKGSKEKRVIVCTGVQKGFWNVVKYKLSFEESTFSLYWHTAALVTCDQYVNIA